MYFGPIVVIRAAASSIASGMPSSRRQISTTAIAVAGSRVNPGSTAAARSTKSRTAAVSVTVARSSPTFGSPSDRTGITRSPSTARPSRLVASTRAKGSSGHGLRQATGRAHDMLAVVEEEENVPAPKEFDDALSERQPGAGDDTEGRRDDLLHRLVVDRGGQLAAPHAVRVGREEVRRHVDREPGLPHAAHAGEVTIGDSAPRSRRRRRHRRDPRTN